MWWHKVEMDSIRFGRLFNPFSSAYSSSIIRYEGEVAGIVDPPAKVINNYKNPNLIPKLDGHKWYAKWKNAYCIIVFAHNAVDRHGNLLVDEQWWPLDGGILHVSVHNKHVLSRK